MITAVRRDLFLPRSGPASLSENNGLNDRSNRSPAGAKNCAQHHAPNAKRGRLRIEPTYYMKATLDRFKLGTTCGRRAVPTKLASAGYRGRRAHTSCFSVVMPSSCSRHAVLSV